jgi:hypothetical protein
MILVANTFDTNVTDADDANISDIIFDASILIPTSVH